MKKIIYLTIILFQSIFVFGQTSEIDSLLNVLKTTKQDTNKVNIFNLLSEKAGWRIGNHDTAMYYARAANQLAQKLNYKKGVAFSYSNTGIIYAILGNYPEALKNFFASLKLNEEIGNKKEIAISYNGIGNIYYSQGNYPEALKHHFLSLKIKEEIEDKKGIADSYNNTGIVYYAQGNYTEALKSHIASLKIKKEIGDTKGIGDSYNNIGIVYYSQGNYPEALENHFACLKIKEEIGNKKGVADSYNNIGIVYQYQGNYPEALKNYLAALKLQKEIEDKKGLADSYNNIGLIYYLQSNYPEALKSHIASLKIKKEIGDTKGIADSYNNIGIVYYSQGNYTEALENHFTCLKIKEEIGDKQGIADSYNNIGNTLLFQHKAKDAKNWQVKALGLSKELGIKDLAQKSYLNLSRIDSTLGNYKGAHENYKMYIAYRDSLINEENTKKSIQSAMQYEFDKKQTADSLKVVEEKRVTELKHNEEKKRNQIVLILGSCVLLLVAVFAVFMYRRFKLTQQQKNIIEAKEKETQEQNTVITQQKHLIEERHKEITDSINYAERIQRSFMATKELLDSNLKNYFVFFKPKDVVSGDFYWGASIPLYKEGAGGVLFCLATADSTGHGVPGAIMSLLNITALEKAIETEKSPDKILYKTRQIIIERLKKDGSAEGGKDGMDCSFLSFDFVNMKLLIAAANNPVWIIRASESSVTNEVVRNNSVHQLIEIKGDRFPVGKHERDKEPFTLHEYDLQKGDVVYTLTDGFPDQFGGEKGKKFKHKQLQELLSSIAQEPMEVQHQKLNDTFTKWKGNLEQVDDVCVIGVRI